MDWLQTLDFSREWLVPIQYKFNMNFYNTAILKKYISKTYIENPEKIGLMEEIIPHGAEQWDDPACFEGFISAALCFGIWQPFLSPVNSN